MESNYKFNQGFQYKIVSLMLRDPLLINQYREVLDPKYFTYEVPATFCKLILDHHLKYNIVPDRDVLENSLNTFFDRYRIKSELRNEYLDSIDGFYTTDLSDSASIKDRIIDFGKRQALKRAVLDIIDMTDEESEVSDYSKALEIVTRAIRVGVPNKHGFFLSEVIAQLPEMARQDPTYGEHRKIKTPFPTFNQNLIGHGIGSGEIMIVMGRTNSGKSMLVTNFATCTLEQGRNVAYYSLELVELDVLLRAGSKFTGVSIQEMLDNPEVYRMLVNENLAKIGGDLMVQYYVRKSVTVATIKSHLSTLVALKQFSPDLIIVDSADHCLPSRRVSDESSWQSFGIIYAELVDLANTFSCPVITTSQIGRSAYNLPSYGLEVIRESIEKGEIADYALSLCDAEDEHSENRCRIYIAKARRGRSDYFIDCIRDLELSTIEEAPGENN